MFVSQPKIFISSTVNDLPNERIAAFKAVENIGAFPVMSEYTMEAQSVDSLTACLSKVMESDIYVLVLGGRYGWQPAGKESITELEYNTALQRKIPVLVFNTYYPKEQLQAAFEAKVNPNYFIKTVQNAFELQQELEKSLKTEIEKNQNIYFDKTETVYSNLVKIKFPTNLYIAELDIDKKEIQAYNNERNKYLKNPSLFDYAISALHMNEISFPRDWIVWEGKIITFHDLTDSRIGLSKIIDRGTAEPFECEEFYNTSTEHLSQFKYLLRRCLETKLHKQKIKWFKSEKLFAFLPTQKDINGNWQSRYGTWTKTTKKAARKLVDVKLDLKDKSKVYNLRCLAFRTSFEFFENDWYLSIKPDWIFLWNTLEVCPFAFPNIQWLKKTERNMHVFNHFNFILRYLQPPQIDSLFDEFEDYKFMKIGNIESFQFSPIIPDDIWLHLEDEFSRKKMEDNDGNVDLFKI